MLQSVPDPFDSYGPPQAEDQIFSILAPLSIMTSSHSSSPSPMTGQSELDSMDSGDKIASWLPRTTNGGMFPSESTEWAASPSSTPSTPPRSVSPPSNLSRRHSTPPSAGQRKAESKLRSVLSVIDETRPRHDVVDDPLVQPGPMMATLNGKTQQPDTGQQTEWPFIYGQSPYDDIEDDPTTPRHSTLFFPQSPPLPPDPITAPPNEHSEPVLQAFLAPAVT
jgi:hypothetical protein